MSMRLVALGLVLSFVTILSACGGGGDTSAPADSPAGTPAESPTSP